MRSKALTTLRTWYSPSFSLGTFRSIGSWSTNTAETPPRPDGRLSKVHLSSMAVEQEPYFAHWNIDDSRDLEASIWRLPVPFLRASDLNLVDTNTLQRNDVWLNETNGKPAAFPSASSLTDGCHPVMIRELRRSGGNYEIQWSDGRKSKYELDWMKEQCSLWNQRLKNREGICENSNKDDRIPWMGLTEESFRSNSDLSMSFPSLISDDDGMKQALAILYHYGILLVHQTPIHDGGYSIAAMAAALGGGSVKVPDGHVFASPSILPHYGTSSAALQLTNGGGTDGPQRTLYGSVWSTSSGGMAAGTR
jgi:hypothetical protein